MASSTIHKPPHHSHAAGDACDCEHGRGGPPSPTALVSVRGATLRRGGRELLSAIDLDVRSGEIVTLIGPNGAGKTTLVKLVLGILRPDQGVVAKPKSTRIGYVPQKFEVEPTIPMTVSGFLGLGNAAAAADVIAALMETGAAHTAQMQLADLSGGETQRVLIARALLRKPNLLVLDEPASGVDFAGEADLYELIGSLRDKLKLGVLLVSHDLHVVMARSDQVLCLNGHVCCSGRPEAVAQHSEYARLFGAEAAKSLAVYHHQHDHRHDLAGSPLPAGSDATPAKER